MGLFCFMPTLTEFIILALGIWRIANMIVDDSEDGPYDILHWIRFVLGERGVSPDRKYIFEQGAELDFLWNLHYQVYRSMTCIWCATFWFSLIFGMVFLIIPSTALVILFPFALSGAALIVNRILK